MRKSIFFLIIGFLSVLAVFITACSPKVIYVPTNTDTHIEYRDSVIYKVDTLKINVPVETVKEVVPPRDTLKMATSVAEAKAWVDTTTNTLKGEMKNKKTALSQPQVVYKEKIQYRDTVITKEVPVPVEVEKVVKVVPWIYKTLSVIGLIALFLLALKLVFKFRI